MYRSIVFAALLGGVGLGAWSSFSAPLKPPGLDFSVLATTLQQYLIQHEGLQLTTKTASAEHAPPQAAGEHAILLNVALSAGDAADITTTPSALPGVGDTIAPQDACGAWSISEVGMEAILQEMIRHGWTPPARSKALVVSQSGELPPLEALDPDAPAAPVLQTTEDKKGGDAVREPSQLTN